MNMLLPQTFPAKPTPRAAQAWRRALELTAPIPQRPGTTLPTVMAALGERFGEAPALLSDGACLSYRELARRVDHYARWAIETGVEAGDVVCLLMPNCPEYMAIWLGITRVSGIVALLNANLVGPSLNHSIAVAAPKHIIVDPILSDALAEIAPHLDPAPRFWASGENAAGLPRIDPASTPSGAEGAIPAERAPSLHDVALYIYTSGTTGLPKAAKISHFRLMQWAYWFAGMLDIAPSDRMYNCLPMYHSVGGVVATGAALVAGASVVVRERFSASRFWEDVVRWDCTMVQYIGELCRYLTEAPPDPQERGHRLRLACGNGLRPDVWERFQERFQIPYIVEFYAATEGNFSLYNCEGKPGAIGRLPPFLAHRFPVALVRFDIAAGEPVRGPHGFCVRCAPDEPGEALGRIADDQLSQSGRFDGYTDELASARKILRNVFEPGDAWYRTGDLMRGDRAGFFYFVDRIGDTFRWKGENCSTLEIAAAVAAAPAVSEAVVYGVAVPGRDGRAGMAALVAQPGFDIAELRRVLTEHLPDYARPVFLRLRDEIATTGTFKPQKHELMTEGFDPAVVRERMFVNDPGQGAYIPLDETAYRRILNGDMRL